MADRREHNTFRYKTITKTLLIMFGILESSFNITDKVYEKFKLENKIDAAKDKIEKYTRINIERSYEREERLEREAERMPLDVKRKYHEEYIKNYPAIKKEIARREKVRKDLIRRDFIDSILFVCFVLCISLIIRKIFL